ncbi:MAG: DUF4065 domain-containing protein [Hyphomicrobiales bacterium]|nr:DUF4065 domain-containing protein [Hyphomicrobiales bacterium]MCY4048105.1 DUF4065 domain-containing protein [Hyphomicrobiales bacterium]MCY4052963.1 DUF4065 domain-containing protein [Hyphomicrobiales bacterium]
MESITCFQGAKTLVQLAGKRGEGLSNLKVQKLLYFANMIYIGEYGRDNPLVQENFLTWEYGPAIDILYRRLKDYDRTSVKMEAFDDIVSIMDEKTLKPVKPDFESHVRHLKDAYDRWGHFNPYKLIGISHWSEGAWRRTKDKGESVISNSLIKEEFDARYLYD